MTYNTYVESSDFGQQILDILANIAYLMDDEHPFTMRELHRIMKEIRATTLSIEETAAKFGKEYFAGDAE